MTRKKKQPSPASAAAVEPLCAAIAEAMLEKKAQNVLSLDLSDIEGAVVTCFVLCNADSTTQIDAIADNVEEHVRKTLGEKPIRREGLKNSIWIVLDYVDVMVHIFQTEARNFYCLESLWADAKQRRYSDEPQAAEDETSTAKTPVKRKAATAKSAVTSPKAESSAKKADTAKATPKKTATLVKKTAAPAKKTATSTKKTTMSAKKATTSTKKTTTTAKKTTTTAKKTTTTAKKAAAPAKKAATSTKKAATAKTKK
ncbi:MAG: ribosome silencing factor [Prevotellaceae bacterium]|jgi:ribosome-associated protein|nr:ribosome silencing factor [Prevotellaceae bacterium]